jgi:transposase
LLRLEEWVDIVSRHNAGEPIRAIARELGISRNTVRATLRREGPPQYRRPPAPSKLDPYKDYLRLRLTEFPELSAKRLYAEICALGYSGGISILKDFTRPHRVPRREPVLRFETPPGRQAQCDFGELGRHEVCGVPTKLYLFVMVLGFSRFMYVEAVTDCRSATFLACHARAFAAFGGVPAEVLYDNAKICAVEHSRTVVTFNEALLEFAGRYGFAPRLCRPYRAKTKGKVERMIGYVKDACLVGRTFTDLADMNAQIAAWLAGEAHVREHATTGERPLDRLERENLAPLTPIRPRTAPALEPPRRPRRPAFRFEELPTVAVRPLAVYEEACR